MKDDCSIYRDKLSAYMDGELSPEEMAQIAAHLEICKSCSAALDQMRRVDELGERTMPEFDEKLMSGLTERIMDGLEKPAAQAQDIEPDRPKAIPIWYRYAAIAASIAIVFLAGRMALKESGGDLLKPSVSSKKGPVSMPVDTVIPFESDLRETAPATEQMTGGIKDRDKASPPQPARREEEVRDKKGEPVPDKPIILKDQAATEVLPEKMESPAVDMAKIATDEGERKAISESTNLPVSDSIGYIAGRVIDAATGRPLPGVSVQVEGTGMGARSDMSGEFVIQDVPRDTHDLIYSSVGYKTMKVEISTDTGRAFAGTTGMERSILEAGEVSTATASKPDEIFAADSDMTLPDIDSLNNIYAALTGQIEVRGDQSKAAHYRATISDDAVPRMERLLDSLKNADVSPAPIERVANHYFQAMAAIDLANAGDEEDYSDQAAYHVQLLKDTLADLAARGYDSKRLDDYRRAIEEQWERD